MAKYKLIVYCSDEQETKEYANLANSLKEAEAKCKELMAEYIEDYPDTYVACYDYNEYWRKDCYGDQGWAWMKMGEWCRIGFYIK